MTKPRNAWFKKSYLVALSAVLAACISNPASSDSGAGESRPAKSKQKLDIYYGDAMQGYDELAIDHYAKWGQALSPRETYEQDRQAFTAETSEIERCLRFTGRLAKPKQDEIYDTIKDLASGGAAKEVAYEDCLDGKINYKKPNIKFSRWFDDYKIYKESTEFRNGEGVAWIYLVKDKDDTSILKMTMEEGIWKLN